MKRATPWPVGVVCITLAAIAGVASVIVTFFLAALTGAGHGSGVPFEVYLAPFGLGLIALPMMILAIGVPRRWLYLSLAFVLLLLAVRIAGAGFVYLRGAHDLYRLGAFLPMVYAVWLVTFVGSCICPLCILVRLWSKAPDSDGAE
jgi:hypothetical protein